MVNNEMLLPAILAHFKCLNCCYALFANCIIALRQEHYKAAQEILYTSIADFMLSLQVPSEGFKRQFSAPHTSASNSPTHTISPTEKIIDTEFFKWSCKMFEQSVMAEFCTHSPHLNNNSPSEVTYLQILLGSRI